MLDMIGRWLAGWTLATLALGTALAQSVEVTVWKSPTCGCCNEWIKHLEANGFKVKAHDQEDVSPIKARLGVPEKLGSCHTATVGGYVIEGHVPASDIRQLLKERPLHIKGLSAPGMPPGSPGMDVPGSPPFDVVSFDDKGRPQLYRRHPPTR